MTTPRDEPIAMAPQRLWLARTTAWALLLMGWLVLGALGRQQLPQIAGGLAPLALWLAALGLWLAWTGTWRWSVAGLRIALLFSAGIASIALLMKQPAGLLLAALAWAALLVAASFSVRSLRLVQTGPMPSPSWPAAAGALLAWALAGDLDAVRDSAAPIAAAIGLAAMTLAAMLPARKLGRQGCRAGLFDCSLVLLSPTQWQRPTDWPLAAAAVAMLPMMASLSAMADWCGALRWPAATDTALHLAAMLLPALLLQAPRALARRQLAAGAGVLLALGGASLLWPGLPGLLGASLLQTMAWSLGWAAMLLPRPPEQRNEGAPDSPPAALRQSAVSAAAMLLLGLALAQAGPSALSAVHLLLGLLGLLGLVAMAADPLGLRKTRSAAR